MRWLYILNYARHRRRGPLFRWGLHVVLCYLITELPNAQTSLAPTVSLRRTLQTGPEILPQLAGARKNPLPISRRAVDRAKDP